MRLVPVQAQNGEMVLINPDQVRCVIVQGIGSKIEFGPGHAIPVTATLEAVQKSFVPDEVERSFVPPWL